MPKPKYTGKPCIRGHIGIRYANGGCVDCAEIYDDRRRKEGYFKKYFDKRKKDGTLGKSIALSAQRTA